MTVSQLMDVQFECNKNLISAKETDYYSHREMGWVNNSTNIFSIQYQIVYFFFWHNRYNGFVIYTRRYSLIKNKNKTLA